MTTPVGLMDGINTVIWDFNGTLVDDLELVVRTVNVQLAKRELDPLTATDYRDVFGFPVEDYYRRLGVTFEHESMSDLSADFFADYAPALKDCRLHTDVVETLDILQSKDISQFVLSAMEQDMLQEMVEHFGIRQYFRAVYGLADQKGESKIARGRSLIHDFRLKPSEALLVGDTDHDAEVAEALGISIILISRGHQSEAKLKAASAVVADSCQPLLSTTR